MSRRDIEFGEEIEPCGMLGLTHSRCTYGSSIDVSDCLVARPRPWQLVIWEPLSTKAPSPARCQPYCCYISTVIFYARPYVKRQFRRFWSDARGRQHYDSAGSFEEYDRVEVRLRFDDLVRFQGEPFIVGGGRVVWAGKRRGWWMRHGARRLSPANDRVTA